MHILTPDDYQTMPWRNGGGITHEIALAEGPNGFAWRLSIAEVATSGPFSKFEGKERILTVIEGNGVHLASSDQTLTATVKEPAAFSGETDIDGQLIDGPIRDFNLIFDPAQVTAEVRVVDRSEASFSLTQTQQMVVHSVNLSTTVAGNRIGQSQTLFASGGDRSQANVAAEGWAIVVLMEPQTST